MSRAVKKFLSSRLIMNTRWLWNSRQRHKFSRAKASRDILKIRVLEMALPGVFKRYFAPWMPCCLVRIHARLGTMPSKCPGIPRYCKVRMFHRSTAVRICIQCHSKLGKGCFTILFNGVYYLLAVMVEGDKSSQLRMAN